MTEEYKEKCNELIAAVYKEIMEALPAIKEKHRNDTSTFSSVLRIDSADLGKVLLFNADDVHYSAFRQQFETDGEARPWILVVVGDGEAEEFTQDYAEDNR